MFPPQRLVFGIAEGTLKARLFRGRKMLESKLPPVAGSAQKPQSLRVSEGDRMNNDDLDRMLLEREEIVPSSGFVAAVMEAVQQEAVAPAPIPFPWKWALPRC